MYPRPITSFATPLRCRNKKCDETVYGITGLCPPCEAAADQARLAADTEEQAHQLALRRTSELANASVSDVDQEILATLQRIEAALSRDDR